MPKVRAAAPKAAAVPTEHEEQAWVITWATLHRGTYPELDLLYSVPNGGLRSRAYAQHLADEGLRKGVPDLHLPVARGGYHGLWLEMKRTKGGVVAPEQREWHARLEAAGHKAVVCRGHDPAVAILISYLDGHEKRPACTNG